MSSGDQFVVSRYSARYKRLASASLASASPAAATEGLGDEATAVASVPEKGTRNGRRARTVMGTFGRIEISVPRARIEMDEGAKTTEWKTKVKQRLLPLSAAVPHSILTAPSTAADFGDWAEGYSDLGFFAWPMDDAEGSPPWPHDERNGRACIRLDLFGILTMKQSSASVAGLRGGGLRRHWCHRE